MYGARAQGRHRAATPRPRRRLQTPAKTVAERRACASEADKPASRVDRAKRCQERRDRCRNPLRRHDAHPGARPSQDAHSRRPGSAGSTRTGMLAMLGVAGASQNRYSQGVILRRRGLAAAAVAACQRATRVRFQDYLIAEHHVLLPCTVRRGQHNVSIVPSPPWLPSPAAPGQTRAKHFAHRGSSCRRRASPHQAVAGPRVSCGRVVKPGKGTSPPTPALANALGSCASTPRAAAERTCDACAGGEERSGKAGVRLHNLQAVGACEAERDFSLVSAQTLTRGEQGVQSQFPHL